MGATDLVSLERVTMVDLAGSAVSLVRAPDPTAEPVDLRIDTLWVERSWDGVIAYGPVRAEVHRVYARDLEGWTYFMSDPEGQPSALRLSQVQARRTRGLLAVNHFDTSPREEAVWSLWDAVSSESHARGVEEPREGDLRMLGGARVHGGRVLIEGGKEVSVGVWDAELRLDGLTVHGGPADGIVILPLRDTRLTRVALTDIPSVSITTAVGFGDTTQVDLEEVSTRPGRGGVRAAVGLLTLGGVPASLEGFDFRGLDLGLEAQPRAMARRGRVSDCGAGIRLKDDADLRDLTSGVRIECARRVEGP